MQGKPTPLADAIARVLEKHAEVAAAWLFGSEARGEARPGSDLDIGLLLRTRGKTALDCHRLLGSIAAELESVAPGRPIDLVLLEPQGPVFCHRVLSEGLLVYDADADRRIDFESDTYVRYFDFRPTYELALNQVGPGMREWLEGRQ